jgi:peptidoglycan hydrolase CwlO-like protein
MSNDQEERIKYLEEKIKDLETKVTTLEEEVKRLNSVKADRGGYL